MAAKPDEKPVYMTLREFTKAHHSGAFKEAVIQSTAENTFIVIGRCKSGEHAVLIRSGQKGDVRRFRSVQPPVNLLHEIGFEDMRVCLGNWSPAQSPLPL